MSLTRTMYRYVASKPPKGDPKTQSVYCLNSAGFTLSKALFGKKCGCPSPGVADAIFPGKKWRHFLVITVPVSAVTSTEKLATFFYSSLLSLLFISLVHSGGVAHYFWHAKICCSSCGGLFVGAPVRPNMLKMPKSAAVFEQ